MKNKIIIMNMALVVEVDERAITCNGFRNAMEDGILNIVSHNVHITTANGTSYDDEEQLEKIKQVFIDGLKGMDD